MRLRWRQLPWIDLALAVLVLSTMALGIRLVPPVKLEPWPGVLAVAIVPVGNGAQLVEPHVSDPLTFVPTTEAGLRLTSEQLAWLRLSLPTDRDGSDALVLSLQNIGNRSAALYFNGQLVGQADPAFDAGVGLYRNRTAYFRLASSLASDTVVTVGLGPGGPSDVFVTLDANEQIHANRINSARLFAAMMSALMTMSLAGLLLAAATRDRHFLLFAIYTAAQATYIAFSTGEAYDWPFLASARALTYPVRTVAAMVAALSVTSFVRGMLSDPLPLPGARRTISIFGAAFIAIAMGAVLPFPRTQTLVSAAGNGVVLLWSLYLLLLVLAAARQGRPCALLMLVGWSPMWFATIARAGQFLRGSYSPLLDLVFPGTIAVASVAMALSIADHWRRQRIELHQARHAAETDGLTKVLNRRTIEAHLRNLCQHPQQQLAGLALLFIDLDHFKLINDRHGHSAGDTVLQAIVAPVRGELRASDLFGRWGGEEFVVLLPGATQVSAVQVAERIRTRLAALTIQVGEHTLGVTASIGVSALGAAGGDADALLNAADEAVYQAKHNGRNRVVLREIGAQAPLSEEEKT